MEKTEHPIDSLMLTAMTSIENMIDVNTVVGDMVTSPDGTIIIPVSKVCFGFAAGGSEFNTNKLNKFSENAKLPFGGGSGAGVNILPMGFLVVKDGNTKLLTLNGSSPVDRLVDVIPDLMNKANDLLKEALEKKNQNEATSKTQNSAPQMVQVEEEKSPDDME